MKVTRFTQSCLLVEENESRILIDPSGEEKASVEKFGKLAAVLYTHEHADHFDAELCEQLKNNGAAIYANQSNAKQMKSPPNVVKDGQEFTAGGFKIKVLELPHCLMPDGSEGPQNVGYLINEKLFHPGDGKELEDLQVNNLALPITGPDVSMKDAFGFATQVGAKVAVPIHYDVIGANPEVYKRFSGFFDFSFEIKPLKNGEAIFIS